ncbi:MAG: hypothetical protein AAB385_00860 [Planctomycetota bacterium]|jgi:hypothetical protein
MTYRGRVKNGVVVIEGAAIPPEGAEVEVALVTREETIPTLAERYKDIIGILDGLPPDASVNHDHYLYGTPSQ